MCRCTVCLCVPCPRCTACLWVPCPRCTACSCLLYSLSLSLRACRLRGTPTALPQHTRTRNVRTASLNLLLGQLLLLVVVLLLLLPKNVQIGPLLLLLPLYFFSNSRMPVGWLVDGLPLRR